MNNLSGIEIFKDLPKPVLDAVTAQFQEKSYKKGELIYMEGDHAEFMWFVKSGRVSAAKTLTSGQSLMVCRVEGGAMFGMCCDMVAKSYQCQATAATDTTVVKVPIKRFLELLKRQPDVSHQVLASLAQRLGHAQEMRSMAQEPVEKRIASMLLTLKKEHGASLPFTRKELAEMVGTTVETSIRVMSHFEKEGIIQSTRGNVKITKLSDLQKIAQT